MEEMNNKQTLQAGVTTVSSADMFAPCAGASKVGAVDVPRAGAAASGAGATAATDATVAAGADVLATASLQRAFSSRRKMTIAALWMLLLALALVAATYAWFSGSRYTNVTPMAHTVSENGYDLLISSSETGPFDTSCTLDVADKTLYPLSTADLTNFWRSSFQNANGITTEYSNCTSQFDDFALGGTFYLQGSSVPLSVYLYQSQMSVSTDPQLLAALRVGFVIRSSAGTQTYIFTCDDLGDTLGATAQRTTLQEGVVVSGTQQWNYVADPAQAISGYTMDGTGDTPTLRSGAQPLFTLAANEVATVRYFVYMEGCDENCINQAQLKDTTLQFAFAGSRA